jgi:hypothetical protein
MEGARLTALMFTTDGLAFLASREKEPGVPGRAQLAPSSGPDTRSNMLAVKNPAIRQKRVQPMMVAFLVLIRFFFIIELLAQINWKCEAGHAKCEIHQPEAGKNSNFQMFQIS